MLRIITLSTLSVVVTGVLGGGVAQADRGGEHRQPVRQPVRSPVRENRVESHRGVEPRRVEEHRRENREPVRFERRDDDRRSEGRRYDNDRYRRESINERYFDYNVRPAALFESYGAPVDGYLWVSGAWQWSGAEWIWVAGHYEAAY